MTPIQTKVPDRRKPGTFFTNQEHLRSITTNKPIKEKRLWLNRANSKEQR